MTETVAKNIRDRLLATPAVAAMIGDRIHRDVIPAGVTRPCIAIVVEEANVNLDNGGPSFALVPVEIVCLGKSIEQANDLESKVVAGIQGGTSPTVLIRGSREISEVGPDGDSYPMKARRIEAFYGQGSL